MALTPEKRAAMAASLSQAGYGSARPQAEPTAPDPSFMSKVGGVAKSMASPFLRTGASVTGALEGAGTLAGAGLAKVFGQDEAASRLVSQAKQATEEGGAIGRMFDVKPVGADAKQEAFKPGQSFASKVGQTLGTTARFGADVGGTGAEIASWAAPGAAAFKGANLARPLATGAATGALAGSMGEFGREVAEGGTFGEAVGAGVKGGLVGGTLGAVLPGAAKGLSKLRRGAIEVGEETVSKLGTKGGLVQKGRKFLGEDLASSGYTKMLKPKKKHFAHGKRPMVALAKEVEPANTLGGLMTNTQTKLDEIGTGLRSKLTAPEAASQRVDIQPLIRKNLDDAIADAKSNLQYGGDEGFINKLERLKANMLDGKPPEAFIKSPLEVQDFRKKFAANMKFQGAQFEQPLNQIKDEIRRSFNEATEKMVPGTRDDLWRQAELISAKDIVNDAIQRKGNNYVIGLRDIGLGGVVGATAGFLPALTIVLGKHTVGSTAVQSRIASLLAKLAPKEQKLITETVEAVAKIPDKATRETVINGMPLLANLLTKAGVRFGEDTPEQPAEQEFPPEGAVQSPDFASAQQGSGIDVGSSPEQQQKEQQAYNQPATQTAWGN